MRIANLLGVALVLWASGVWTGCTSADPGSVSDPAGSGGKADGAGDALYLGQPRHGIGTGNTAHIYSFSADGLSGTRLELSGDADMDATLTLAGPVIEGGRVAGTVDIDNSGGARAIILLEQPLALGEYQVIVNLQGDPERDYRFRLTAHRHGQLVAAQTPNEIEDQFQRAASERLPSGCASYACDAVVHSYRVSGTGNLPELVDQFQYLYRGSAPDMQWALIGADGGVDDPDDVDDNNAMDLLGAENLSLGSNAVAGRFAGARLDCHTASPTGVLMDCRREFLALFNPDVNQPFGSQLHVLELQTMEPAMQVVGGIEQASEPLQDLTTRANEGCLAADDQVPCYAASYLIEIDDPTVLDPWSDDSSEALHAQCAAMAFRRAFEQEKGTLITWGELSTEDIRIEEFAGLALDEELGQLRDSMGGYDTYYVRMSQSGPCNGGLEICESDLHVFYNPFRDPIVEVFEAGRSQPASF